MNDIEKKPVVTRRPATPGDIEFARTAHHRAYHEVVVRQFGSWDESAQNEFFKKDLDISSLEIIESDGVPCGYVSIEDKGDFLYGKELVLLPEYQGRGIGTEFLVGMIKGAIKEQRPLRIQALKANKALELYRRLGFRDTGGTNTHSELEFDPARDVIAYP